VSVPPPPLPPGRSPTGHGPFGEKAFRGALVGCGALVVIGLGMMLAGGEAVVSVGTSFVVLGALGLAIGGGGLLAERLLGRRPTARPDVDRRDGRGG
jgi:hypothetical protein